jgi:phage-related protein
MWEVEFYTLPSGACPTKEFLDSLDKKDELPFAIRKLNLLRELGNQLRRPHADYLEGGIYELRIPVKHMQYRLLYFYFYQEKIIISHGLRKETKVKTSDIEKAKKHKANYFAQHERKS